MLYLLKHINRSSVLSVMAPLQPLPQPIYMIYGVIEPSQVHTLNGKTGSGERIFFIDSYNLLLGFNILSQEVRGSLK